MKTLVEILFELLGKVFKLLGVLIQDKVDGLHLHVYIQPFIFECKKGELPFNFSWALLLPLIREAEEVCKVEFMEYGQESQLVGSVSTYLQACRSSQF